MEVFESTDMEWLSSKPTHSAPLPPQIIEWQKLNQNAYWRSKALSLELENKILREHLRKAYANFVEKQVENEIEAKGNEVY